MQYFISDDLYQVIDHLNCKLSCYWYLKLKPLVHMQNKYT
jgi:hypothetical protein